MAVLLSEIQAGAATEAAEAEVAAREVRLVVAREEEEEARRSLRRHLEELDGWVEELNSRAHGWQGWSAHWEGKVEELNREVEAGRMRLEEAEAAALVVNRRSAERNEWRMREAERRMRAEERFQVAEARVAGLVEDGAWWRQRAIALAEAVGPVERSEAAEAVRAAAEEAGAGRSQVDVDEVDLEEVLREPDVEDRQLPVPVIEEL